MRQQLTNVDAAFTVAAELGDELRYRVAETDPALFHQLHHASGRRYDFGQRGEIEDGVFGHRLWRRLDGALAERVVIVDRFTPTDENDRAGQFVARDGRVDERGDGRKPRARLNRSCGNLRDRRARDDRHDQRGREDSFHGIQYILPP